jgi:hypothetical protein
LMKRMGLKSRELVERRFSAEAFAENFRRIYSNLLDSKFGRETPWPEAILDSISLLGSLGLRTIHLEHEVRDLRRFEASFKSNFFYRGLRSLVKSFRK